MLLKKNTESKINDYYGSDFLFLLLFFNNSIIIVGRGDLNSKCFR